MKHHLVFRTLALAAALLTTTAASAGPIVASGSSYGFLINPAVTANSAITDVQFDGVAENFTLSNYGGPTGVDVSINESQSDLGGGLHEIAVRADASGDLAPSAGEAIYFNIGWPGNNPLDLVRSTRLVSAFVNLYINDVLAASADFVPPFGGLFSLNPWDGYFLNAGGTSGGYTNVGGLAIDRVDLVFRVQELPEPTSLGLALAALGLLGVSARRKR